MSRLVLFVVALGVTSCTGDAIANPSGPEALLELPSDLRLTQFVDSAGRVCMSARSAELDLRIEEACGYPIDRSIGFAGSTGVSSGAAWLYRLAVGQRVISVSGEDQRGIFFQQEENALLVVARPPVSHDEFQIRVEADEYVINCVHVALSPSCAED